MVGLERLLIGRTLDGRYTIEELIGQGRGGLVYRARHGHTGVEVALKVLSAPRSPEARERFRKVVGGEVKVAASIEHPNVAGVYCLGHDGELDLDFVTTELLRGQTLASVLSQRGKPPIALGLRLLADAAEGLAAGHRAGLVHRDVRPASLYLVRSESERQVRVKVAGFGVPQLVRRESLATAAMDVRGYASPETLAAGTLRLTPASDVFSLAVVGFELLTGSLPFDDAGRQAMAEGRSVEPDAPHDVAASVPPQVVDAVLQALRADPATRFADGAAFSAALQQSVRSVVAVGKIAPASPAVVVTAESLSPAADAPIEAAPGPVTATAPVDAAPVPVAAAVASVDAAPELASATAVPVDAAPEPASAGVPVDAFPAPDFATAASVDAAPELAAATAASVDVTPEPASADGPVDAVPASATAAPADAAPKPNAVLAPPADAAPSFAAAVIAPRAGSDANGGVDLAALVMDDAAPPVVESAAGEIAAASSPAAPSASADAPLAEPVVAAAAVAAPVVAAVPERAAAKPAPVAPPPADLTRTPVKKPALGKPAAPDLELYYPPQVAKPGVVAPVAPAIAAAETTSAAAAVTLPSAAAAPAVAPPVVPMPAPAAETAVPTPPIAPEPAVTIAAAAPVPAPVAPSAAVDPAPAARAAETPSYAPLAAVPAEAPALTPMPGARRRQAAAAARSGNLRGSAMAAGFVLGIAVLGSVAWIATRRGAPMADAAGSPVVSQLAQAHATAGSPASTQPAATIDSATPAATPATTADTASRTREERAAELRKKQQDDERRRQEAEKQAAQLLQQQQLAQQQARAGTPVTPAPATQQPQVAIAAPPRPAPQPAAAPPPAPTPAPAREEPAAATPSNAVFDEDAVEERPRLTNINEIQRALQDRYPAQLYANHVSGRVTASFTVGPDGRVDGGSIRILNSPNPGFNAPTAGVLRRARFRPARVKGQPVRVQVTMPVAWTIGQ